VTTSRPVVIDCSVAIAIALDEPGSDGLTVRMAQWAKQRRQILVPGIFWLEVINVLARTHRLSGADVLHAIHSIDAMTVVTVDPDRAFHVGVIDAVERHGLSAYDAAYLVLTELSDGEIATLDLDLARAAGPRAILLDGRHRLSETPAPYEHDVTWPNYKGASAYLAKLRAEAREAGTG
jgi:predicted nucleic acid-binding protein